MKMINQFYSPFLKPRMSSVSLACIIRQTRCKQGIVVVPPDFRYSSKVIVNPTPDASIFNSFSLLEFGIKQSTINIVKAFDSMIYTSHRTNRNSE